MTDSNRDREKLLQRIRALASKTVANGCSEAEALAAADLLARLVDKYGFTDIDLEAPAERLTEDYVKRDRRASGNVLYAPVVADFCDCEVYAQRDEQGQKTIRFFGFEPDVMMARYIMDLLSAASKRGYRYFTRSHFIMNGKALGNAQRSFDAGFAHRISSRLKEMKARRNAAVDGDTGKTGGALVLVKNAVVKDAFAKHVELGEDRRRGFSCTDGVAFRAGREAGGAVAINPGVGANTEMLQLTAA